MLLDTNVLTPILDGRKLSVWLEAVLANNKNAVAQFSIAEHLCRRKALQSSYQAATQALRNRGIAIVNGPYSNRTSTELLCDMLILEQKVSPSKPILMPGQASWKQMLVGSRVDLALACEGHVRGYSFLTKDGKFCSHCRSSLTKWGLTTYCVPNKALLR
ncbi:hypothetical protein TWF696_000550 [Orbilia brochopaga]|uniref:PIN domain-containing protein n=1 Tax=Orbilia brochopaga TaxID=3140254 RepID=A0AAV9VBP4_9PEZI